MCPIRTDLCYAVKELARSVAVKGSSKWRLRLSATSMSNVTLKAYSDSDWANCVKTRKSTSGYTVKLGSNAISFGSQTQANLAMSSGETELYALCNATVEALHVKKVLEESLGTKTEIEMFTDSTAGKSMANRFQEIATH